MTKKFFLLVALLLIILGVGITAYLVLRPNKGTDVISRDTGIRGAVLLGPTCPVEDPGDSTCNPQPYQTQLVVTASDQVQIVKEFSSDKQGKFNVTLPPGEYAIRSATVADTLPYCSSAKIEVIEGSITNVIVNCDSGLR